MPKNEESTVVLPEEGGVEPEPPPPGRVTGGTVTVLLVQLPRMMSLRANQSHLRPNVDGMSAYSVLKVLFLRVLIMTGPTPLSKTE
jgi:hypothetical protein